MVSLRKLSTVEIEETEFVSPSVTTKASTGLADVRGALSELVADDASVVEMNGVTERAMKRRITIVAKESGLRAVYAKTDEFPGSVVFRLAQQRKHRTPRVSS